MYNEIFARNSEFFFSDSFLIQLKNIDEYGIEGRIVHYPIGLNLVKSFRGLLTKESGLIKFSFFIEWSNPNLNEKVLTAYSGEIFRSGTKETRLTLEWLQVSEDRLKLGVQTYKGCEVLRGCFSENEGRRPPGLAFLEKLEGHRKGF